MSSPSAFERRGGPQGATGPTGPGGPTGATGPPSPAVTLSGNTTGTLALVSTGTLTLAGGNNITLSQSGNHVTISGANVAGAQTAISGIANSQTTYTSGTVSLSELGAITIRSTTGNQFQLSVNAQTAQTGISGVSNSNTTYTSGTIGLSELGAITIRSTTGNQFQFSVNSQTVQTQNAVDLTLSGNTSGALALVSSGTATLAGGANITLSQAGNAITISGAAGGAFSAGMSTEGNTAGNTGVTGSRLVLVGSNNISLSQTTGAAGATLSINAPASSSLSATGVASISVNGSTISIGVASTAPQTGISGIANSQTTYTSGTVSLSELGAITIRSTTGNQYQLSVNAQTNQAGSVYASSNTFGTSSGTYDARSISIAGRGAVSVAASNSGWIISAPTQTTQVETQTFVGGIANSETTYTSGTVSLSELGAVTIRSTTGNQFQISVNAQSVQPETQTFIGGISASDTVYTSGTVRFTGSNMITVKSSGAGQTVILDATQSVQTQSAMNLTLSGNSTSAGAGYALISSGTMALAGGPNVTLSQDGNTVSVSAGGGAETQTAISGIVGSNATYTSGTVTFTGVGGGVTVSSNTGQRIDISVAAPVAQTNQAGSVYASSNTFGTSSGTYDARTLSIAGAGAVSVAASNSGFVISVPAVVAQTNQSGNVYASSNTFGTSSGTYDARSISIAGSGAVGVAASNSGFVISAPSQTNQAGSVYAASNTSGTSSGTYDARTLSIVGAGLVTVAASNSGWRIDATSAAQTNQTGNVYASSNTTGTSSGTYDARSISIAGAGAASVAASNSGWVISAPASSSLSATGAVSISVNASTISIGAPTQTNQAGSVYAVSNTSGTSSGTYDARTLSIAGGGQVSVAASNSGWIVSVPNPVLSYRWIEEPLQMGATQGIGVSGASNTTVTAWVSPVSIPSDLAFNNVNLAVHCSFSSATTSISSVNYSFSMGASLGFYTLNASTLSLVTSFSGSLGYSNATAANVTNMSMTARVGMGGSSTTKSTQGGANMSAIMSSIDSVRQMPLMWTTQGATLTRGQYFAIACFSANTGSVNNASLSQVGFVSNMTALGSAWNPPELMKNTASVTSPYPFLGLATMVNSSNSLMPNSLDVASITKSTAIANSTNFQSLWMRLYSSHAN